MRKKRKEEKNLMGLAGIGTVCVLVYTTAAGGKGMLEGVGDG